MHSKTGKFLGMLLFVLAAATMSTYTLALDRYPVKVVKLVTHSNPGSGSDVFLRKLGMRLGPIMGVKFVVENVKGGAGSRAMAVLANAKPDGSIFYATTPTFIFTSQLSSPKYTYKDLEPVVNVFTDQEILYTRANGPYKTLKDVISHAQDGRGRWGASTPGSLERQALERLKEASKVKAGIVTHSGGGELLINVLNGTLDMGVGEFEELLPQLKAGNIRLLAVIADKRMAEMPDMPTVKESGYPVSVRKFRGLAGPKGLPPAIIAAWEAGIQAVLKDPEYMKVYQQDALTPDYMPQAEYAKFIDQFAAESADFFKTHGVTK